MSILPLGLMCYRAVSWTATPLVRRWLQRRVGRGKEDADRLGERFGYSDQQRPVGPLIWIHAASVGESLSILELVERFLADEPDLHVLVTSGTVTSAQVLARRLPPRAFHQFIPVDLVTAIRRFLDHWKPDLVLFTESEIWPSTILETAARDIPMALVNGRISRGSAQSWGYARASIGRLLGAFSTVLAQDEASGARLRALGANPVHVTGSLKESAAAPTCDEAVFTRIRAMLEGRPIWLAASTHPGEEDYAADAHRTVRLSHPDALLILVPRHPERADNIAATLCSEWRIRRWSTGAQPDVETDILLADTLGEMGLWYRLCSVAFVGGSLVPIGGHNPFEPAALGAAIVHGPHVANFEDSYARLAKAEASISIDTGAALGPAVSDALRPEHGATLAANAWSVFSEGALITDTVLEALRPLLPRRGV